MQFIRRRKYAGRGLTLVEVLAALVIIGGCITAMLVSQGNCLRRIHDGVLALTAREAAQELIASWRLEEENLAVAKNGTCEGLDDWTWRRSAQNVEIADGLTVLHVALVLRYAPEEGPQWLRRFDWVTSHESSEAATP